MTEPPSSDEQWHAILTGRSPAMQRGRHVFSLIPSDPRCKLCNAPFSGIGGLVSRVVGRRRSRANSGFCNGCELFAREHPGGAEVELSMLFADVRGSTGLAERLGAAEFARLMNRFFLTASRVLVRSDAMIDKLVGDEVIGFYLPGFAGPDHAALAIEAARELLRATGHGQPAGPWLPIGAGVHTGVAFAGSVGNEGNADFAVLGDAVNTAARLASEAAAGEILVSNAACEAAAFEWDGLERRRLELKGRSEPVTVCVLTSSGDTPEPVRSV